MNHIKDFQLPNYYKGLGLENYSSLEDVEKKSEYLLGLLDTNVINEINFWLTCISGKLLPSWMKIFMTLFDIIPVNMCINLCR